jgi:hypothetical protein
MRTDGSPEQAETLIISRWCTWDSWYSTDRWPAADNRCLDGTRRRHRPNCARRSSGTRSAYSRCVLIQLFTNGQ